MKLILIRLVRIYFGLGAVFGGLGILSLVWGVATHANCGELGLVVAAIPYAVFSAVVRVLFWLPSLVHWWLAGPEAFLQWLLPGLFITCGTSPMDFPLTRQELPNQLRRICSEMRPWEEFMRKLGLSVVCLDALNYDLRNGTLP
jgi:hypothetical protein